MSLADRISAVLSEVSGGPVEVTGLEPLTGGSSREIWQFRAALAGSAARELVLRMDHPGEPRPAAIGAEAGAMAAAASAGVPVPEVIAVVDDGAALGAPALIMEKVDGLTAPRRILAACENPPGGGARLASECGAALGRLHRTPLAAFPGGLPRYRRLDTYRAALDRIDPNRPVLELAYRYLTETQPPARDPVAVHGDFRVGNLVTGEDGCLQAVLDWESCHVSDALEDLGWIAVRAWRFGGPGVIGGFGDVGDFLAGYGAQAGWVPAGGEFEWALVLGTWIWAVGCLEQAERHLTGRVHSVDLAVVGRRVVQIERDLLELLP